MPSVQVSTYSADATESVAVSLGSVLSAGDVILLIGDLAAGKTQFTKGIARGLGIDEAITSPTFNIVTIYDSGRVPLQHFDLYRLNSPEELEDIDFYASTDDSSDAASVIEWADLFSDEMPEDSLIIHIKRGSNETERLIHAESTGSHSQAILDQWSKAILQR